MCSLTGNQQQGMAGNLPTFGGRVAKVMPSV